MCGRALAGVFLPCILLIQENWGLTMANRAKQDNINLPVARLLRCRNTRRYFTGEGWTENPAEAAVFGEPLDAVRACVSHNLQNIELVLRIDGTHVEIFSTTVR